MKRWIRDVYMLRLLDNHPIKDMAIFPRIGDCATFAIFLGGWWEHSLRDPRYMRVQDYIDKIGNVNRNGEKSETMD